MRGLIRRVSFLLILLVLLSLNYSQSLEMEFQIKHHKGQVNDASLFFSKASRSTPSFKKEGLVFDGFKEKSLEGKRQKGTDELLQFVAGGHVLGFRKGGVFVASGDHVLRVEFLNAQPVLPVDEGASPDTGNNRQAAKPLGRVSYSDLWDGVTLVYERHSSGVVKSTYTIQHAGTGAPSPVDRIRLRYNVPVEVDDGGNLVFSFETGRMKESRPVAWQEIKGEHIPVEVSFCSLSEREVGFKVGLYDPQFPLVIDPIMSWNTFLGSSSLDYGRAIALDTSGNVYVAGSSNLTWGTPVNPHAGSHDAFVAKLDSSGVRQWNTFMGSSEWDEGFAIALDTIGNVYVAGYSRATWGAPVNPFAGGYYDAFAAKLDRLGYLQWNTFMGSADWDNGYAIAVDTSGNVYTAGKSNATWGTPVNPFAEGNDAFVAKLDSSGVRQWNTFLGSSGWDWGHAIALDTIGNIYVAGESQATWGTPVNPHAGSYDAFAAKLNSSGVLQWNTFMGSSSNDNGRAIAVDGSGNICIAGYSYATWGTPVNAHAGDYDAFAAKLDSSGVLQWNTFMGSDDWDCGTAIAIDTSGNVYVTGRSYDWGTPVNAHAGGYDVYAAKLNSSGVRKWNTFMGSEYDDYGDAIAVDESGNVYVTGRSISTWGMPVNPHAGISDAFAAKIAAKEDLLGTWDSLGVWYRNSEDGSWVKMSIPAQMLAAGDLDGDNTSDLIGVWSSGLWAKYSVAGTWAKICTPIPSDIASGDMDGDGRCDVLGSWSSGVYYKNMSSGNWVHMTTTPASHLAAGDLDGDGTDDLIGVWSTGTWVRLSSIGRWMRIATEADWVAAGDMNGNGSVDFLGTWSGLGVYYMDTKSIQWVKMSTSAQQVSAGDIDGDGTDDLIGTWSSGVWVKYSESGTWEKICTPLPSDIDAGLFRTGWGAGAISFEAPIGGVYAEGPGSIDNYVDLSSEGPGGWNFAFQVEENLVPQEKGLKIMMRIPGPGEPGFRYIEQRNLMPQEEVVKKRGEKNN